MKLLNPIKISYKNLMAAKFRSFLTMLGIIIGVGSVILIVSIGQSAQELILDQVRGVGSNLIGVLPGSSDEKGPPASVMGIVITTLKYDDFQALVNPRNVPEVESGAAYITGSDIVEVNKYSKSATFVGTTASYLNVENAEISQGRFFNKDEDANLSRVAVLGSKISEELFGAGANPLNKKIKIKDQNFTIIGVFKPRGSTSFGVASQDGSVYIPLQTGQKLLLGINHLTFIRLKVKSTELIPSAIANTKITLRQQHGIKDSSNDDFSVRDQQSAVNMIKSITDVLRYFLLTIGTVSLIVGGIGIMNIMLIAVSQRIKEVGLRKAVGAKNGEIISQFLIESAVISSAGGIIGIIGGVIMAFLASLVMQKLDYVWPFLVSPYSIAAAFFVSVFIGIIFGIYPARKASRISPMEALRYE
ncbi:MAG: ABC transporter permease [Patescibacteria group bacterium]